MSQLDKKIETEFLHHKFRSSIYWLQNELENLLIVFVGQI